MDKGTTYAAFAGTYPRREDTSSDTEMLSPEHGSALELLGRIALTSYLVNAEGLPECMLDLSDKTFDNDYMKKFLLTYTDLFLVSESDVFTEGSDKYLYYAFTEDSLNDLFATVSAGSFSLTDFDISGSDIHFVNRTYYVPCLGIYSGGLLTPEADPELVSDTLTLNGVVSKSDNTDFDIKMILSTEENTASGTTGIKITAISYRLVQ